MTTQATSVDLLVFSDDSTVREEVIQAVGTATAEGTPITVKECATAEGVRMAIQERDKNDQHPFNVLILDAETKKLGGMGLAHELLTELDVRPPVVLLTARPQDQWLASWAQADVVVSRPLDAFTVEEAVATALTKVKRPSVIVSE
ncbi:hypothetical protein [Actinomyces vulturis]|uniref:hypothetical protein n=1 Tax=Actinomyces vulturis TaxID=1857645 RepID=UPI0008376A0E|nr:hypothetical protein [Actinomyces vulturis]